MSCAAIGIGGAALIGAGVAGAGSVAGALIGSNATGNAAKTQAAGEQSALELQQQEWEQQQANQAPYLQAGQSALAAMQNPAFQQNFTAADFTANPGYQFQLQQGNQALQQSAAAGGGLQSGGTLKAMAGYTQGLANTTYQQAYENFMQNKTTNYNELAQIAGMGQNANGQLNQAGMNFANQSANATMSGANAQAGAQIAQGQALAGGVTGVANGISGGVNGAMTGNYLSNLIPQNAGPGALQMPTMGGQYGGGAPSLGVGGGGSAASMFGVSNNPLGG